MSGHALTAATTMQCPHGGQVQVTPANSRVKGDAFLLTASDTFSVAGCVFTIPPGQPSPCVSVSWLIPDLRVTAGAATLSRSDTGVCLNAQSVPQGPVSVVQTQTRVTTG
jgi:hypothetical protein